MGGRDCAQAREFQIPPVLGLSYTSLHLINYHPFGERSAGLPSPALLIIGFSYLPAAICSAEMGSKYSLAPFQHPNIKSYSSNHMEVNWVSQ